MRNGVAGLQRDRGTETFDRLGLPAQACQRSAEIVMCPWVPWLERDRCAEADGGRLGSADGKLCVTEPTPYRRIVGAQAGHHTQLLDGVG